MGIVGSDTNRTLEAWGSIPHSSTRNTQLDVWPLQRGSFGERFTLVAAVLALLCLGCGVEAELGGEPDGGVAAVADAGGWLRGNECYSVAAVACDWARQCGRVTTSDEQLACETIYEDACCTLGDGGSCYDDPRGSDLDFEACAAAIRAQPCELGLVGIPACTYIGD